MEEKEYSKRALELGYKIVPNLHKNKRLKRYTIDELRQILKDNRAGYFFEPELLGDRKIKTRRAKVYFKKGFECVLENCDVEGLFFSLDIDPGNGIHLDLYGTEEGRDILMTIDHIYPKSLGGKDVLSNYQPMCLVCNHMKSDKIEYLN